MSEDNINPAALFHMDVAQDEIFTYATLLNRAQSSLTSSMQAFERANENSLTSDCPIRKQVTQVLREQYAALSNLTAAIIETLAAPTLSRLIKTAPNLTPQLATLLEYLPEAERSLITVVLARLLETEGKDVFLSQEQVNLAASILYAAGK